LKAERRFKTPAAFRQALTDRLKALAKTSRWSLPQLQRQFAYDRLLERLYQRSDGWIVKGAAALLARDIGSRATVDLDVYHVSVGGASEADLRAAAAADIGDWFRFEIGPSRAMGGGVRGVRLPVAAYVGTVPWAQFNLDVASSDLRMTGSPERVAPLARIIIPGVEQHGYRAYPLVDHVADKIAAILQVYGRDRMPSTRYKDLVDLVAIIRSASFDAEAQRTAVSSEAARRGIEMPQRFVVPDREMWERGYRAEAARSHPSSAATLDEALAIVRPFIDPLLDGTAAGQWSPQDGRWDA
jgi:hypothetical protein